MASKDQSVGALIFIFCIAVSIVYLVLVAAPNVITNIFPSLSARDLQFGAIATVVLIAFLAIMFIGAWIGWTMATTSPPKPMEDLENEIEEESKDEAKKDA
jgi:predicted DNA-binding transcriptional regulator